MKKKSLFMNAGGMYQPLLPVSVYARVLAYLQTDSISL